MKKLLFSLFFIAIISSAYAHNFKYNGINYTVLDEDAKTCKTSDKNPSLIKTTLWGDAVIPSVAKDGDTEYTVTAIGKGSFSMSEEVTSVTIPNTVTSIGDEAFGNCQQLISIDIPESVTHIGKFAFWATGITSIILPSSLTEISEGLLQSCYNLTSVIIPNSVKSIGDAAFTSCI